MAAVAPIISSSLILIPALALAAPADTLVVRGANGKLQPGAAKSWKAEGTKVTFELADGVDGPAIAKTLSDALSTARVTFLGGKLEVTGVPSEALLEQLSALSLSGGGDPLADLADLGSAVAMTGQPEGGGSIRASRPTAMPGPIADHDPAERFLADVVEIKQGSFPATTLKLKVRGTAKAGPLKKQLKRGKIIEGPVVLVATSGNVDFSAPETQRNLAAFYLTKGDRVSVHVVQGEKSLEIDWIERKRK